MSPTEDDVGGLDGHAAFLALHRHAGNVPDESLGVSHAPIREALAALLDDDSVPASANLEVLSELAKDDFPDYESSEDLYRALASKVAGTGDLDPDQLLTDLKMHARGDRAFTDSDSASSLPHEVTAFFGDDICHTFRVQVDGKQAIWLFSEFETDAPFKSVAEWVDPNNWPKRSPMVFKSMTPVGAIQQIPGIQANAESWHANFEEVVELAKRLRTELHIDFTRLDGVFAGSTYDLARSLDDQIDVDRGFLLVNDLGATRNVKCLKVVGFTDNYWDDQALAWACLSWTHFLRSAVKGGTTSTPSGPQRPHGSYTIGDVAADWFDCVGKAGKNYLDTSAAFLDKARHGYDFDDAVRDSASLFLSVARDWSNATAEIFKNMQLLAASSDSGGPVEGVFANLFTGGTIPDGQAPVGVPGSTLPDAVALDAVGGTSATAGSALNQGYSADTPGYEGATLPWQGLTQSDVATCGDMVRLGAVQDRVPASDVALKTVPVGSGWFGVHLEIPVNSLRPGLYIGEVTAGTKGTRAFQIYVSKAKGSGANG